MLLQLGFAAFGYSSYKGKQKEIVEAAVSGPSQLLCPSLVPYLETLGQDVLVVAPTGMGKVCWPSRDWMTDSPLAARVYAFKYQRSPTRYMSLESRCAFLTPALGWRNFGHIAVARCVTSPF
jgi:hypothetical protein